jgi:polyisoprenoid-binding protein YceI
VSPTLSRRSVVAAAGTALAGVSGCLFGAAHRGSAESVSGQVVNDVAAQRTVSVRLERNDGGTDLAEAYNLADERTAEFEVEGPAASYTLVVETNDGVTGEADWDVTPCSSHVHVTVGSESVEFQFSKC